MCTIWHKIFPLTDPLDYEPAPDRSLAALAEREGRRPEELALEILLERGGRGMLYLPLLNYSDADFGPIHTMLTHPNTVLSLSDGGAHCGIICDAGTPTMLLTHWVRGRTRGPKLPLEFAVRRQTSETAQLYGLHDRGLLAAGKRADVNVIDLDALRLHQPELVFDLPAGGRRLIQKADGYRQTIKGRRGHLRGRRGHGRVAGQAASGPAGGRSSHSRGGGPSGSDAQKPHSAALAPVASAMVVSSTRWRSAWSRSGQLTAPSPFGSPVAAKRDQ